MLICIRVDMHICICVCAFVYIHIYIYVYVYMYIPMRVYVTYPEDTIARPLRSVS